MSAPARSQRDADLAVLMSLFSRVGNRESASRLARIKNSLTAGGYLTVKQFDSAVGTLLRLQMAMIEGADEDQALRISGYGEIWLSSNFHWVEGDRAKLEPNDKAWVMTPPDQATSLAKPI